MTDRRSLLLAATALALPAVAPRAQTGGGRSVRLVVPFPAGGATDLVARSLQQKLGERLGATLVVDNKPGAGGAIGSDLAAKAPPDGQTLLLGQIVPAPAAGDHVHLQTPAGGTRTTELDVVGGFRFDDVPAGFVRLHFQPAEGTPVTTSWITC